MLYQLGLHEEYLRRLCVTWQKAVGGVTPKYPMPESWGPSPQDLIDTAVLENTASYDEADDEDDGDYIGFGELEEEEDNDDETELIEVAEESALVDAYRQDLQTATGQSGLNSLDDLSSSPVKGSSPRKRKRLV